MLSFTVFDLISKNLHRNADRTAIVWKDESVTYGELANRVESSAALLHALGVARSDRVGIHLNKCIDEVVATFAAARIGAVFVNINSQWKERQLEYIVRDCGIRVLFTSARLAKKLARLPMIEEIDHIIVRGSPETDDRILDWDSLETTGETAPPNLAIDSDLAALLYTSGSTGAPKGVMVSHQNIVLGARSVVKYLGNSREDRILSLLPFSFDYGLNQMMCMFLVGGCLVLQPVSIPSEIARTMEKTQVTGVALVPPSWVQLLRFLNEAPVEFPALRYVTNSGGKIPQKTLEGMIKHFPGVDIFLMYGLTEAFRSTYLPPDLLQSKMGSIGKAIPNAEVFVVDPERGICGPGEQGELIHRGALISLGYWNNQEATDEKIKANKHLAARIGEEKVLHSGDLVRIDEDGFLWFVGRTDSMIKCSGFRLSPTEVEDTICRHDSVIEAVAFGVEDDELGQAVHAAVSCSVEADADTTLEKLSRFCVKQMPSYMTPRRLYVRQGNMPRTANGKIDRTTVIELCMKQKAQVLSGNPTWHD